MDIKTPEKVLNYLKESYIKYYDSAFWVRDEKLLEERRQLLSSPGVATQDLLLESVPPYPSSEAIADVCSSIGLRAGVAEALGKILFGRSDAKLRSHQAKALVTSLSRDSAERNVVVTSGTGSGKTESFLLPVLARLLEDRLGKEMKPINPWWMSSWSQQKSWMGLRESGAGQDKPAVKAMLLYPTNALVEDQISRLRRAAINAQQLSADGNPLFYFGRYTGATEGGTWRPPAKLNKEDRKKIERVADYVRAVGSEAGRLAARGDMDTRIQFSDPTCGEMLTRWDMIDTPPDILITNISMLNIMLMRDVEDPIFEQTKEWLSQSSENEFTLIVDELHSYRGTQGTEVAMVVRNLLQRLGLTPDSEQLRCIGTSASLDGDKGRDYLQQFFGVAKESFIVEKGVPRVLEAAIPLKSQLVESIVEAKNSSNVSLLQELSVGNDIRVAIGVACEKAGRENSDHVVPATLESIGKYLLGEKYTEEALEAIFVAAASEKQKVDFENPLPTFRSHMFIRQIQGMWACSNPNCDQVDEAYEYDGRTIGRLFKTPALKCPCGGQVLELLYCYDCGEAYLGGFVSSPDEDEINDSGEYYLGSTPTGDRDPGMIYQRTYGQEYMWYWPCGSVDLGPREPWSHGEVKMRFVSAEYDSKLGYLTDTNDPATATGVMYLSSSSEIAAIPEQCPSCLSEKKWLNSQNRAAFLGGKVESPIRAMRTGLNANIQLAASRISSFLGETDRAAQMIIFTDSRDDASDVAGGLELNHFWQLIRQLVLKVLSESAPASIETLRGITGKKKDSAELDEQELAIWDDIGLKDDELQLALIMESAGVANEAHQLVIENYSAKISGPSRISWPSLVGNVERELIRLGVNPAGPEVTHKEHNSVPWWLLYEPPQPGAWKMIAPQVAAEGRNSARRYLSAHVAN